MRFEKITLIRVRTTPKTVNQELQFLGESLGLFGSRDKDKSCFRIFVTLLKAAKHKHMLSSDQLAHMTDLTRGTVVHHLNNMIKAGLIIPRDRKYILPTGNLEELINIVKKDIDEQISELMRVAKDIDEMV